MGAGFDQLSVGIKEMGEPAPTSMVKCWIKLIVKYSLNWEGRVHRSILPPTDNLHKPAPTQRITPINHPRPTVKFH